TVMTGRVMISAARMTFTFFATWYGDAMPRPAAGASAIGRRRQSLVNPSTVPSDSGRLALRTAAGPAWNRNRDLVRQKDISRWLEVKPQRREGVETRDVRRRAD